LACNSCSQSRTICSFLSIVVRRNTTVTSLGSR
jgi:hypothetical protein